MTQGLSFVEVSHDDYAALEQTIQRLPLTQSSHYSASGYFQILNNDIPIGIFTINEHAFLKGFIHAVTLDCGPVWFDDHGTKQHFTDFSNAFHKAYPNRIGRKRRWIPNQSYIPCQHWTKHDEGYKTIWIDLNAPVQPKKNWRGALKKAQNSDLDIIWDSDLDHLPFILKSYDIDKKRRGYSGLSVSQLETLIRRCHSLQKTVIGRAVTNGGTVAYIIIICHGTSATYLSGWTHDKGRAMNAHHLLLWNAVNVLKQKGINDFDLGGINEQSSKGVARFKIGMGGDAIHGSGLFI